MSETCPHCRRFREERDEALERLRQAAGADDALLLRLQAVLTRNQREGRKLQRQHVRILAALYAVKCPVGLAALADAMQTESENPNALLRFRVWELRRAGFAITNTHGAVYELATSSRAQLDALLDEKAPA